MKAFFAGRIASLLTKGALLAAASLLTIHFIDAGILNLRIQGLPLPEYAVWTGIVPLEHKLGMLREFASQGPVDAVVIGASISDHGLSAAVLSRDLSAAYGRPFRVFNLSTGGAELRTLRILYRLTRAVVIPKQIWIAFPVEQNIGDELNDQTPDYTLLRAPVGVALRYPVTLPVSLRLFQLPVVKYASALRDSIAYGKYINRPNSQQDVYGYDAFGDTRGFLFHSGADPLGNAGMLRRKLVVAAAGRYAAAVGEAAKTAVYFSPGALDAIAEIRALAGRDHSPITLLAHDSASGFAAPDDAYQAASDLYFRLLSERFGAALIDVRASFHLTKYNFADTSHLNSNGADEISALMAARIAHRALPRPPVYEIAGDVSHGVRPFTAVIVRQASEPRQELQLSYVQGPGIETLRPGSRVQIMLLLPGDRGATVAGRVVSPGKVLVDTSALPPSAGAEALFVQISTTGKWGDGANVPLASYRWSVPTQPPDDTQWTDARVSSGANSYTPIDAIHASWTGVANPAKKDWIGVFPVRGDNETRLSMMWTGGAVSGELDLPPVPTAKPGQYELRLYSDDGWNLVATSEPFSIGELTATIAPASSSVKRGSALRAIWSKLEPARKDDWVGIFSSGGSDKTRLAFKYLDGKPQGAVDLDVPSTAPPGDYELRLYAAGGWTLLKTSASFKVVE